MVIQHRLGSINDRSYSFLAMKLVNKSKLDDDIVAASIFTAVLLQRMFTAVTQTRHRLHESVFKLIWREYSTGDVYGNQTT